MGLIQLKRVTLSSLISFQKTTYSSNTVQTQHVIKSKIKSKYGSDWCICMIELIKFYSKSQGTTLTCATIGTRIIIVTLAACAPKKALCVTTGFVLTA